MLLEKVQREFLRFVSHVLKIPRPPRDYAPVANIRVLCLSALAERWRAAGIRFINEFLNGKIESSEFVSLLYFNSTTNYIKN